MKLPPDKKELTSNLPDLFTGSGTSTSLNSNLVIQDESRKQEKTKDEEISREACVREQTTRLKRELTGESSHKACNQTHPENSILESDKVRTKAQDKSINDIMNECHELPPCSGSNAISDLLKKGPSTIPEVNLPPFLTNPPMAKPDATNPYENEGNNVAATIGSMLKKPKTTLAQPILRFDINKEAAYHNLELLRIHNYDLTTLCNPRDRSSTTFGSEFKEVKVLEELFYRHPRWNKLKQQLTSGVDFYLDELDNDTRRQDVRIAFARGNHKSASKNEKFLEEAME